MRGLVYSYVMNVRFCGIPAIHEKAGNVVLWPNYEVRIPDIERPLWARVAVHPPPNMRSSQITH